jgi:cytochrome c peroxidase
LQNRLNRPACDEAKVAALLRERTVPTLAVAAALAVAAGAAPARARTDSRAHPESPRVPTPAMLAAVGRAIFFDTNLSEPAGTSCASCHDPEHAFAGTNHSTNGLPRGSRPGHFARRASPSLLYLRYVPTFRFAQEGNGDDPQAAPVGGFFWDGRADSIRALTRQPLLNPDEMNNRDARAIAMKLDNAPYANDFRRSFGGIFDDGDATLLAVGRAVEAFLTSSEMAPFTSKFDQVARGRARLTPLEQSGMRLFKDPRKGGCAGCHQFSDAPGDPARSLFTDYGYDAVGAPHNRRAPARARPDLGLCERTDAATPTREPGYCINFRTPSLRNVAVRGTFMHNGTFTDLRDVVAFYATRDTSPRRWYPSGAKFDDVPKRYRGQVNRNAAPYGNRKAGDQPALDDQEIDAIVAFLRTLTDARYLDRLAWTERGLPSGVRRGEAERSEGRVGWRGGAEVREPSEDSR